MKTALVSSGEQGVRAAIERYHHDAFNLDGANIKLLKIKSPLCIDLEEPALMCKAGSDDEKHSIFLWTGKQGETVVQYDCKFPDFEVFKYDCKFSWRCSSPIRL